MNPLPLLRQALHPGRLPVMLKKAANRLWGPKGSLSRGKNLEWLAANACDPAEWAKERDAALWEEAEAAAKAFREETDRKQRELDRPVGGGAAYTLLYFLTRLARPRCVVETGVATGHSSHAFLSALRANGQGRLYSSDFPYFRLPRPERYIGALVPEKLRGDWTLLIDGDETNLPRILKDCGPVDLFHYDSDKSYSGRRFACDLVLERMAPGGLLVMDDLQDNSFFHDLVRERGLPSWQVFAVQGKYVGLIGSPCKEEPGA